MRIFTTFFLAVFCLNWGIGQMVDGVDTLYGNEWIDYNQSYYKVQVANDGVFRITGSELAANGVPVATIQANQFQLFHLGKEVPIYVSSTSNLNNTDYINFYGSKNRAELESHLFTNPEDILNPRYSLFTDTSAYFLTWSAGNGLRYETVENDTINHPAPLPYFIQTQEKFFTDYWAKKEWGAHSKFSHFDVAEGFSTILKKNQSYSFTPVNPYLNGPDAQINVRYASRGADHHQEIRINNTLVLTDEYNGWAVRDLTLEVAATDLGSSISYKMKGLPNAENIVDRSRISLLTLAYPQVFDFEGQSEYIFDLESTSDQYLVITNFNTNLGIPILYDAQNGQRFEGKMSGTDVVFMLPQIDTKRHLVLVNGDEGQDVPDIHSVSFVDYASANSDYLMVTSSRFFDDGNGTNWIQEYADYRSSVLGGSYNPLIVDIQQIYDQFGYGVQRYPIGIRNMAQWAVRHWDSAKYLYLIGKGRLYNDIRSSEDLLDAQPNFFVPTFGAPAGDNLLVTSNFNFNPVMSIGRLAVTTPDEIRIYLDKVKGQEINQSQVGPQTIADQDWRKRFVHLGGGGEASEKIAIKNYLEAMEAEINTNEFAGLVNPFYKSISDPIQQDVPEEIFARINDGAVFVSIFGHASPGAFDFNIDNPSLYFNEGKYPILMSMGCYSGNMFTSQKGISERFCLYEKKGMIGFLGTSNLGLISTLGSFGKVLYQKMGENVDGTIGGVMKDAYANYNMYSYTSDFRRLVEQFMLNGDPAVRLGVMEGVDYVVDYQSIDFGQATISTRQDSFQVAFDIKNLGVNYTDSVSLKIKHFLPSGSLSSEFVQKFLPTGYNTHLTLSLPNPGSSAIGQNKLWMEVDYLKMIEEKPNPLAEQNNILANVNGLEGVPFFIADNSTYQIAPPEFGIKNKNEIELIASTNNAFAKATKYIIEVDTTETFMSPLKMSTSITQPGGLIKWTPEMDWQDNTVYYWRISPDSISPDLGYLWSYSSFLATIDTVEGWNQSHFYQFKKDDFNQLEIKQEKDLEFETNGFYLSLKNKVNFPDSPPEFIYDYGTPAASVRPWNFLNSGLAVFVGDRYSGSGWKNFPGGLYGSYNPGTTRVFSYPMDTEEDRAKILTFLQDIIPDSSYVWVFSVLKDSTQDFHPELWAQDSINLGQNIFSLLESEGATKIRNLESLGSVPYTFMYIKGQGKQQEDIALSKNETIFTQVFIPVKTTSGNIQSRLIGPASSWIDLKWQSINKNGVDFDTLNVWGVSANLSDTSLLYQNVEPSAFSLASINAGDYPYLFLKYNLFDDVIRSAPDLDYWQVYYLPLPEMAISSNVYFDFHSDTIEYGDKLSLDVALENISGYDMDSILVQLKVVDQNNGAFLLSKRFGTLDKQDVDTIHLEVSTTDLSIGTNKLILEANPFNDQSEFFHGNNFGIRNFLVVADKKKPVLDVFFDGIRIVDGDLVSSKPEIIIILDDENKFLMLEDTSLFHVNLLYPDESMRQVYFSDPMVVFEPAESDENQASITFSPELKQDGIYELVVRARDVQGNSSGNNSFKISFEVINKSMISNVLPYPNPFSTSTRFVYTLTGDSSPEFFNIQIYSVDGRVVREITQDEIGPLKVGTHLTEYQWDGRDEYGDLLANGVYMYRLIVKDIRQVELEKYQNNTDSFFKKSFGKIVILR